MNSSVQLAFFWSKAFLTSRRMLWLLFWVNLLGTIYGYEWYWNQMQETVADKPLWLVVFVPDSPTASFFFTLTLVYLLIDSYIKPTIHNRNKAADLLRSIVEGLAVMASFKYGIWAVAIILLAAFKGEPMNWQDWMLSISHGGMAIEALLFLRFFRIGWIGLGIAALWIFGNDYIDYYYAVFPWLPDVLYPILDSVQNATIGLSICTCVLFGSLYVIHFKNRV
ncbi:DUF1405 domain-containing protein [Paenibacillus psychroresistens]|uniref:DUF1405 domain-containing protein n=1 Tax=Paenibacillus psychroresistens TaxID=1778678 RepID=A0A6B8RKN2_9BACL|nr:DUF1405 domain-containing protein [Paenibacillus psychroresistens]QGQ96850.1 DUF1405 domain-containing protein [Paenibacillus psychroresistens]